MIEIERVFENVRSSYLNGQRRVQIEQLIAEIQRKFTLLKALFIKVPYVSHFILISLHYN